MKISYNWLKDYLDVDLTPSEVAEILTLAGLEVEEIHQKGSDLRGVVVGEVLETRKHPNADRLTVCSVDLGNETVQIVCGAPNVSTGQKVAVATVGTTLPLTLDDGSNLLIRASKIRGEVSHGMICAEDELGLGSDHSGILVLDQNAQIGTPIKDVISVEIDHVFEIGLTPNRPDASCHLGVARDLAAVLNKPLKKPYSSTSKYKSGALDELIKVRIEASEKCHRYVGVMIRNVTIAPSPDWLKNRLTNIGLRPINNVVDATNFVLHELGQPLHAFDYDHIAGKQIIVKTFPKDVNFTTLDEHERAIPSGALFICDAERPVALAGIMGGLNSEISEHTKTVFLESAYFEPVGVRKTSRELSLQTDSSYRFERGVDPNITAIAAHRCASLIAELTGGEVLETYIDVHPKVTEPRHIPLRLSRLNRIVGMEFTLNQAVSTLKALEFDVRKNGGDIIDCIVPTFRPDITEEIDLIEEIVRIYDYNRIPNPEYIKFSRPESLPFSESFQERVREILVNSGYREIYASSLLPEAVAEQFADRDKLVFTLNPISRDTAVLRPSLIPGFIRSAAFNFNRDAKGVSFFEIGNVFQTVPGQGTYHDGVFEETRLLFGGGGTLYNKSWNRNAIEFDIFEVKATLERLFRDLRIWDQVREEITSGDKIHYYFGDVPIGEIQFIPGDQKKLFDTTQPLFCAEVSLTTIQSICEQVPPVTYQSVPKYPAIEFDLAVVVPSDVSAGLISSSIRKHAQPLLKSLSIFDLFEGKSIGEGNKSIAFRLIFQDDSKTLTIKDVDSIIGKVMRHLEKDFQAKLRS